MRIIVALLPLALCGCSMLEQTYTPEPLEITDAKQYASDVSFCQAAAAKTKAHLDIASIASGAGTGAAQNAVGAAVNPVVPVIGAAGGAGSALVSGLDVLGHAKANVARHCVIDKTRNDRSAIVAQPED